jgi:hypothetical protein
MTSFTKIFLMTYAAFPPFPRGGESMCLPSPCIIVIPGFLVLMTIDAPVQVIMASLAVVLIVIELIPVFLYPARICVFYPPVLVIKRHTIIFNMFVADIACNLLLASFFVAWNTVTKHVGDKVYGDRITLFYTLVALITLYLIFEMYLMGKF